MDHLVSPPVTPQDIVRTLVAHPRRWILPTIIVGLAALVFAILKPRTWEAAQTLLVRDEISIDSKPGVNSTRADETKAAQETILELANSQSVLRKALEVVGPDARQQGVAGFPTPKNVEELGEALRLVPPTGGEFGKTDIFYLKIQDRDRERALHLARVVSEQVQQSYEELRKLKAKSLILELEKTVALAKQELDRSTSQITRMEKEIGGSDLGELRILNELPSGMSDLRNESFALETEQRKELAEKLQNEQLLAILKAAQVNPGELVACPNSLLNAQPGLKRLKDGLVDLQIKTATLMGTMSPDHPQVLAAQQSEGEIGANLHDELSIAIRAIEADLRLSKDRIAVLDQQKARLHARLDKLAEIRAEYGNLSAMSKHRGEILKAAELELAEARSKQAAAHSGALLQLIGEPVTGSRPIGPGRTMIVLGGIAGGLILGLGLVVLTAKPQVVTAPQWSDARQRVTDHEPTPPAAAPFDLDDLLPPKSTREPDPVQPANNAVCATPALAPATKSEPVSLSGPTPAGPLTFRQALERIMPAAIRS